MRSAFDLHSSRRKWQRLELGCRLHSYHSMFLQPPIQVYGVEGRYATALFSAASKQKSLDKVEQELGRVFSLIKDPKLSSIVMNPHVKRSVKQKTFINAMTNAKLSPITINLV
ncbi:hypothetical protein cypCar_00036964, partial [Cyprinus carpio]